MRTVSAVAAAALLLSGCASTNPARSTALAQQVPTNYRQQIVTFVKATFKDPYSIRSAGISAPTSSFVGLVNGGEAPGICITFNAKNAFGAYIGQQVQSVAFRNGSIMGITDPLFGTCENVSFEAFPELEMMT